MKIIYTIILLLLATTGANAYEIIETVTEVIDGDTFKTTERGKPVTVRIADIDCPELQQPGGQEAKQFTTKTLLGTLISIKTSGKKQNGIITAKITTNRGKDMAVLLIQKGLAWPAPKTKNKLVTGQCKKTINNKIGIWAGGTPEPPWQYRKRTQKKAPPKIVKRKSSLYGDSAADILRDRDGSAIGKGGGFIISNGSSYSRPSSSSSTRSVSSSSSRYTDSSFSSIIMSQCKDKWDTNYRMVKYCVNNQKTAKRNLSRQNISPTIKRQCEAKWGTNYRMVKYCVDNQTTAKGDLTRQNIDPTIKRHCKDKWGTNYRMVKYCVDNQTAAKRSLGY